MARFFLFLLLLPISAQSLQWTFSIQKDDGVETTHGSLIATRGSVTGLVCDDSFNDGTAHYICKQMGYANASGWTNYQNDAATGHKLSISRAVALDFALDDVRCTGTNGKFERDCSFSTTDDCTVNTESVIINCLEESNNEFNIISGKGELVRTGGTTAGDPIGSVVASLDHYSTAVREYGTHVNSALVCPPGPVGSGYPKTILDMICRQSGYIASRSFTTHRLTADSNRANCFWAGRNNITTVTLDIGDCEEGAERSDQCRQRVTRGGCNIDDTLVIRCTSDRADLLSFQILANPDGGRNGSMSSPRYATSMGTVVVTYTDLQTRETVHSLVRSTGSEEQLQITATAICTHLAYRGGTYFTQREMAPSDRISCGFVEEQGVEALISEYSCPTNSSDAITECDFTVSQETWDMEEALAVECFSW